MQGGLEQQYKVSQELARNDFFSGSLVITQLPRLAEIVISTENLIDVSFEFAFNEFQLPSVKGRINTQVWVQCQRCLEPMQHAISQEFEILIDVTDSEAESYQMDSVYTEEGYLDIYALIEDEIILSLPLILTHPHTDCNPYMPEAPEEEDTAASNNPFAVLQSLRD